MLKTLLSLTTAALFAATCALAQEAASTPQEIETTFTWTSVDLSTVPMGESQMASVYENFVVMSATEGPLAGRCVVEAVSDLATMGVEETGTCVYHDTNGDQLWERVEGTSVGNGAPYEGTATWIGGTGRFEGASGEVTVDATFSAMPQEGVYQGTGTKIGTLVLPSG